MTQRTELLGEDCRLTALGIQLRDAREAMGLSDVDVAQRLYISVTHIRAMEEGRYELMPAEVFARGYLRAYARLLNLDPEAVLRKYRPERPAPPPVEPEEPAPQSAPLRLVEDVRQRLAQLPQRTLFIASGAAIVLVLCGVIALLVFGGGGDDGEDGQALADAAPAVVVNPELFKVVDDAAALGVNLPQTGDTGDGAAKSLEIRFSGDSWVEVRDSSRRILLADMRRAGDREVVMGEPPYQVMLGRSAAVAIRYQGRWIDIEPETGKAHAQVVIGG